MKKTNAINGAGLILNSALLTLSLALLAGTAVKAAAGDNHARILHPEGKASLAQLLSQPRGQKVFSWWWLRRP